MAASNIFQLTGVIAVEGLEDLASNLTKAVTAGNLFADALEAVFHGVEAGFGMMIDVAGKALGAFKDFSEQSVQEAVKIERLTVSFGALYHSMGKGREEIEFLREVAKHTVTDMDDLAAASLRLTGSGLNSGRFIEMADKLGQLLTPGRAQGMMQVADSLGRIASGSNMGRAIQILSRTGIGYNALKEEGVKMTENHHITSSPEEVLAALERIYQKRFGDLGKYLETTMTTAFSNLQDAWNYMLDSFGKTWFPIITSIIESLTPFFQFLAGSGVLTEFGTALSVAFQAIFNAAGGSNTIVSFLAYVIAVFETLPNMITTVGAVVQKVYQALIQPQMAILNFLTNRFIDVLNMVHQADAFFGQMLHKFLGTPLYERDVYKPMPYVNFTDPMDWMGKSFGAIMKSMGLQPFDIQGKHDEIMQRYHDYKPPPNPPNPAGQGMFNDMLVREDVAANKQTAANTAKISAAMEPFKRFALGGGERGRIGIALSERYGNGHITVQVSGTGNPHFDRGVEHAVTEYHQSMRRAGLGGN